VDDLGVRFMHFNYVPTGRAKAYVELDLSPSERLSILEVMGRKIADLSIRSKEEAKKGKSNMKVDSFFSTCPQYASVVKRIAKEKKQKLAVSAHYATMKGVESVADFLGGCGAARLYMCVEPNGDIKPCVFFPTNKDTIRGNIIRDDLERIWDLDSLFWRLRSRDRLKSYEVAGRLVGCGVCEDKYICGGCRARSYSYFSGDVDNLDVGCIENKEVWERILSLLQTKQPQP
jgi:radical SAM protein with 4Fe4S-binding SPASM domain